MDPIGDNYYEYVYDENMGKLKELRGLLQDRDGEIKELKSEVCKLRDIIRGY